MYIYNKKFIPVGIFVPKELTCMHIDFMRSTNN